MRTTPVLLSLSLAALIALAGCTESTGPSGTTADNLLEPSSVIEQDLSQLAGVGIPTTPPDGVFSIGWKQFVGPMIPEGETVGEAFAVVHATAMESGRRPEGIDIGSVALTYGQASNDVTKRTTPRGGVFYSTFDHRPRRPGNTPVSIPFLPNTVYRFTVSGSGGFTSGSFEITSPATLLGITSHANRDPISRTADLVVTWTGGSAANDVVLRLMPHFRPMGMGGPGGHGGPPPGPPGGDPPRGIVKRVPNTGTATITAAEIARMLEGSNATEVMLGAGQVVENTVQHDGKNIALLLRNGDRVVLLLQ